jgi:hypothetical protein
MLAPTRSGSGSPGRLSLRAGEGDGTPRPSVKAHLGHLVQLGLGERLAVTRGSGQATGSLTDALA